MRKPNDTVKFTCSLTEIEAVTGCTFACICHTVFRMLSCLQINWQPFYLRQLLKFHKFDWLIEFYLQTEGQGTQRKIVSLQPMPGFSPLLRTVRDTEMIRCTFGDTNVFFHSAELEAVTGCTFACICHTVFRVFSCLQINWQPFYIHQLLKFHPFD